MCERAWISLKVILWFLTGLDVVIVTMLTVLIVKWESVRKVSKKIGWKKYNQLFRLLILNLRRALQTFKQ